MRNHGTGSVLSQWWREELPDVWGGKIAPARTCPDCSRPVRTLEHDGYCYSCATGEVFTGITPERALEVRTRILASKSAATLAIEAEAARHLAEHAEARRRWREKRFDRRA